MSRSSCCAGAPHPPGPSRRRGHMTGLLRRSRGALRRRAPRARTMNKRRLVTVLMVLVALSGSSVARGQLLIDGAAVQGLAAASPAVEGRSFPQRVGVSRETSLTLEDAIAQALMNNPDVSMARIAVEHAT